MNDVRLHLVQSTEDALSCLRWLSEDRGRDALAFDTETTGLQPWKDSLRLVQFGDCNEGWAIPWDRYGGLVDEVLAAWRGPLVAHNTAYDLWMMEEHGLKLDRSRLEDTMVQAHILDPRPRQEGGLGVGLKPLSTHHIHPQAAMGEKLLHESMEKQGWTWATVPVSFRHYWAYGALDTVLTARLHQKFRPLVRDTGMDEAYELELAVLPVLVDMAARGVRVDREYLRSKRGQLLDYVTQVREWARSEYQVENLTSNAQAIERLKADGVSFTKFTDSGQVAFDKKVVKSINHPLAKAVLEVRKAEKVVSSYFDNLLENADGQDIVHCNIRQLGARTGRMSISNPPLQQMPSDSPLVRDAFLPREGQRLALVDYDAQEFRILADLSGDDTMLQAIRDGVDLHKITASRAFQVAYEDVTKEQRDPAKNAGYATLYGSGIRKLAQTAGISEEVAEEARNGFYQAYPRVQLFVGQTQTQGASDGFVWGGGRRHPVTSDTSYKGTNYRIQGEAAAVLKRALVRLDNAGLGEYLLLPVHDEVVSEVPTEAAEEVGHAIRDVMEDHRYKVPLTCGLKLADRWGQPYRKPETAPTEDAETEDEWREEAE